MSKLKNFLNTIGIEQIKDNGEFITQTEYNMIKAARNRLATENHCLQKGNENLIAEIERLKRINRQKADRIKKERN